MLILPPIPPRRRRRPKAAAPVASAPVLLSGVFDNAAVLTLVFDQAIAVGTLVGTAIQINDPASGESYECTSDYQINGATIILQTTPLGDSYGDHPTLTASGACGIQSANGAITWAGVTEFALNG